MDKTLILTICIVLLFAAMIVAERLGWIKKVCDYFAKKTGQKVSFASDLKKRRLPRLSQRLVDGPTSGDAFSSPPKLDNLDTKHTDDGGKKKKEREDAEVRQMVGPSGKRSQTRPLPESAPQSRANPDPLGNSFEFGGLSMPSHEANVFPLSAYEEESKKFDFLRNG